MINKKLEMVKQAFRNSDAISFAVGNRIIVCYGEVFKHKKEGTIEFTDCSEADIKDDATEYNGEVLDGNFGFVLYDPQDSDGNTFETVYYNDELVEQYIYTNTDEKKQNSNDKLFIEIGGWLADHEEACQDLISYLEGRGNKKSNLKKLFELED